MWSFGYRYRRLDADTVVWIPVSSLLWNASIAICWLGRGSRDAVIVEREELTSPARQAKASDLTTTTAMISQVHKIACDRITFHRITCWLMVATDDTYRPSHGILPWMFVGVAGGSHDA